MIAQQLLRLVQELAFVLRTRSFITSPQLRQKFYPCPFTHRFIHSGQGNPTFGATYSFTALFTPSRLTILLAQFAEVSFRWTIVVQPEQFRILHEDSSDRRHRLYRFRIFATRAESRAFGWRH